MAILDPSVVWHSGSFNVLTRLLQLNFQEDVEFLLKATAVQQGCYNNDKKLKNVSERCVPT